MSAQEQLYAVVWGRFIHPHSSGGGYGLVITSARVVGSWNIPWLSSFSGYLGSDSDILPDDRTKGARGAAELMARRDFELPRDSVTGIFFKDPGTFVSGHVTFRSDKGDFQIDIKGGTGSDAAVGPAPPLKRALVQFAPDRAYDEATGTLLKDERPGDLPKDLLEG
ncbi:MAG: hypothetical protein ABSF83_11190 [Nitrososphaerales archaeon]|jgi:hypothetical protein